MSEVTLKDINAKYRETLVEMALQAFLRKLCLEKIYPLVRAEQGLFWSVSGFREAICRVKAGEDTEFTGLALSALEAGHEKFRQAVSFLQDFPAHGACRVLETMKCLESSRIAIQQSLQTLQDDLDGRAGIWPERDLKFCAKATEKVHKATNEIARILPRTEVENLEKARQLLEKNETKILFAMDRPDLLKCDPLGLLLEQQAILIKTLSGESIDLNSEPAHSVRAISWDFSCIEAVVDTYADIAGQTNKDVRESLSKEKTPDRFEVIFSLFSNLKSQDKINLYKSGTIFIYPSYDAGSLIRPGIPLEADAVWGLCANLLITYEAPSFVSFSVAAQPSRSFLTWLGVAPHNRGSFSAFYNPIG